MVYFLDPSFMSFSCYPLLHPLYHNHIRSRHRARLLHCAFSFSSGERSSQGLPVEYIISLVSTLYHLAFGQLDFGHRVSNCSGWPTSTSISSSTQVLRPTTSFFLNFQVIMIFNYICVYMVLLLFFFASLIGASFKSPNL